MNPIIPEEPEIRKEAGNSILGFEEEESLTTIIDSVMSPFIIDRNHSESEDEFESTDYGDNTIDCVLPTHTEDNQHHSVIYLDSKFRRVELTLMVRATGMLNDLIIFPLGFIYLMAMAMASSAHKKIIISWRKLPHDIRQ